VTLKQVRVAREWNIAETFQREHNIASTFMHHPDFVEGVSARLINRTKERPNWSPNTLEDVTEDQVDAFFAKPRGPPLGLLETGPRATYNEYPHQKLALPTEEEVLKIWDGGNKMAEEVVQHFVGESNGKVGVREKVEEVLERQ
jgi:3-hydroxyisobutyryl-CoA hydrolase